MSLINREALWLKEYWDQMDTAVRQQADRVRVAQKVFNGKNIPDTEAVTGEIVLRPPAAAIAPPVAPIIPAPAVFARPVVAAGRAAPLSTDESTRWAVVEIWVAFTLRKAEVESEEDVHHGFNLAVDAARQLALAEDRILFQGVAALPTLAALNVSFRYPQPHMPGMLALDPAAVAGTAAPVRRAIASSAALFAPGAGGARARATVPGAEAIFAAFAAALADLNGRGQSKPHGFIVHTDIMSLAHSPTPGSLVTPESRISKMVDRGFHSSEGMERDQANNTAHGLLVSLTDTPVIHYAMPPTVELTQADVDQIYHFRVVERFQAVVRDIQAYRTVIFDLA